MLHNTDRTPFEPNALEPSTPGQSTLLPVEAGFVAKTPSFQINEEIFAYCPFSGVVATGIIRSSHVTKPDHTIPAPFGLTPGDIFHHVTFAPGFGPFVKGEEDIPFAEHFLARSLAAADEIRKIFSTEWIKENFRAEVRALSGEGPKAQQIYAISECGCPASASNICPWLDAPHP